MSSRISYLTRHWLRRIKKIIVHLKYTHVNAHVKCERILKILEIFSFLT